MKQPFRLDRPALTAIAAVLALSSTAAVAQVAPPPDAAPPVEIAPAQAAPAPSASVAPAPIVAPPLPQLAPSPTAEAAPPLPQIDTPAPVARQAAAPAPVERSSRPAPVARTAAAERAVTPAAQRAVSPSVPVAAPGPAAVNPIQAAPQSAGAPSAAPAVEENETPLWIVGIGGAVLALGLGAFAWSQRRRSVERREAIGTYAADGYAAEPDAPILTPAAATLAPSSPAYSFAPVTATPAMAASAEPVSEPMARAASPLGHDHSPELEAMVAAPPSAENPFLTRSKRIRRANYILAQRQTAPLGTADQPVVTAPATAGAIGAQYRPQPVYDFGKTTINRRPSWKPVTS